MSWDAYLTDDRGHCEGEWNYTHNCNRMIEEAISALGRSDDLDGTPEPWWSTFTDTMGRGAWWHLLDGMSGLAGGAFLKSVHDELLRHPAKYQAMNPPNGWGDYDSLLGVLREMFTAVPEWPCTWSAHG